ncbi:MAG TPA: NUDIX hydrolase [Thermoanaerobaculia bacterium]|jgi:8-oxo-dGTP pyrophosphatase MutT (NUDIX family)
MATVSEALPAASVIVLRDGPLEVLMLRRNEKSSFVPNAWVFPGGIAEPLDHELAGGSLVDSMVDAMRITGARETFEETGVWLGGTLADAEEKRRALLAGEITLRDLPPVDLTQLTWTSRWITPIALPKRFDTYFFLAKVGRDAVATVEDHEAVEVLWIAPQEALARTAAGTMQMVFPTIKNLEALRGFDSADALIDARRGAEIAPIQPVLVVENGEKKLVIP